MSRYSSNNTKSRRERIGFYTALTICLVAICMAVYSTYSSVTKVKNAAPVSNLATGVVVVDEPVSRATQPMPTLGESFTEKPTEPATEPATEAQTASMPSVDTSQPATTGRDDALETMLAADVSLSLPTKSGHVLRAYTRDSVYNKTLNIWKPHPGADFDGELGEDVFAMLGGEVTKIYDDKMLGKTVEITVNNVTHGYSGLAGITVRQGDTVERGDKIGTIGVVPVEASDKNHIHVYVRVNNTYADPLSFVDNEN